MDAIYKSIKKKKKINNILQKTLSKQQIKIRHVGMILNSNKQLKNNNKKYPQYLYKRSKDSKCRCSSFHFNTLFSKLIQDTIHFI